ncbi:hypothetical protein LTS02_007201 [Friedmanniomyces endolithicus]|nr:hypothetical protein LTS02_007201 [Friedmanniomyces endolithicus]
MQVISRSTPAPCYILVLPDELLIHILELAATTAGRGVLRRTAKVTQRHNVHRSVIGPSTANQRLSEISLEAFYGINTFGFSSVQTSAIGGVVQSMPDISDSHDTTLPTTTTDLRSSLVVFAFAGPSSPQRPSSTTERSASQHQEGNYIRLPHFSIRGMMKRLELVLLVPDEHEHDRWDSKTTRSDYRPRYTELERDWLLPVRPIQELGFHRLKELEVVIKYRDHIDAGANTVRHAEERLDEWVDCEMVNMSASRLAGKVTVTYGECMERKFGFSVNTSDRQRLLVDVSIEHEVESGYGRDTRHCLRSITVEEHSTSW